MRIILLVDMDCFFAQVEERERPELKGRPVVVGSDPRGRGVVSTCNYEARKFGIKSAMPISLAFQKCSSAVFLPVNMDLYAQVSRDVMVVLHSFANKFEQVSIDEAFLDVSDKCNSFDDAVVLARELKKAVLEKTGLTCSVGIACNKLLAKIGAGENKPDGLTLVSDGVSFLADKKVGILYGVGVKTNERLNSLGVFSVSDLRSLSREVLVDEFGSFGVDLFEMARGVDNRVLVEEWIAKSVGRQFTFDKDTRSERFVMLIVDDLIRDVYRELRFNDFVFRSVTFKVRFDDFETHTRSKTFDVYSDNLKLLRVFAIECVRSFLVDGRKFRLVGLSVSHLASRAVVKKQEFSLERFLSKTVLPNNL